MGLFAAHAIVLTEKGCKTIQELFSNISNDNDDVYIIINGEKHKCNKIDYSGRTKMVKVTFENGMDVYVNPKQEFVNDKGEFLPIEVQTTANCGTKLIALNKINLFIWNNNNGTYDEGYILALVCHNTRINDETVSQFISLKISNTHKNHTLYYPYKLITDYFKDKSENLDISLHMKTNEWTIYRLKSNYFRTLLKSLQHTSYYSCRNIQRIYEHCSYDFAQGYLRGIFDMEGEVCCSINEFCESYIILTNKCNDFLKYLQRILYHMGIACIVENNAIHIKGNLNMRKFRFIIGFGIDEKQTKLDMCISTSKQDTNNYLSGIKEIADYMRDVETYTIEMEKGIIAINGVIAKT
jgi:hypothetical protein